jgi:hypothetical protein
VGFPRVARLAALPPRRSARGYIPTPHPGRFAGDRVFAMYHNIPRQQEIDKNATSKNASKAYLTIPETLSSLTHLTCH